jgi:hypothetical protein
MLAEIATENFRVELAHDLKRDANEDADVGAYIVMIDGGGRKAAREFAALAAQSHPA